MRFWKDTHPRIPDWGGWGVYRTFPVKHSIEEVLRLSLQPAEASLFPFGVVALRQQLAAGDCVVGAVILQEEASQY